jgi:arginine exporter protein ArgO
MQTALWEPFALLAVKTTMSQEIDNKPPPDKDQEHKKRKQCVEFILEECRMVIPGVQALFGFQLIAAFNQRSVMAFSLAAAILSFIFFAVLCFVFPVFAAAQNKKPEQKLDGAINQSINQSINQNRAQISASTAHRRSLL